jgi:hypothetical protein
MYTQHCVLGYFSTVPSGLVELNPDGRFVSSELFPAGDVIIGRSTHLHEYFQPFR